MLSCLNLRHCQPSRDQPTYQLDRARLVPHDGTQRAKSRSFFAMPFTFWHHCDRQICCSKCWPVFADITGRAVSSGSYSPSITVCQHMQVTAMMTRALQFLGLSFVLGLCLQASALTDIVAFGDSLTDNGGMHGASALVDSTLNTNMVRCTLLVTSLVGLRQRLLHRHDPALRGTGPSR